MDPYLTSVAELLELAAINVESSPGRNVLDAIRDVTREHVAERDRDAILVDTFYRLLDYLPAHVESLAYWSDSETSDRVAGKLRQLARSIRNGGPAHVDATPPLPLPADPATSDTLRIAGSRNRRPEADWPRDAQLRLERGRIESALTRMRRAKHPRANAITARELRLVEIDRELAELALGDQDPSSDADLSEAVATPDRHRDRTTAGVAS